MAWSAAVGALPAQIVDSSSECGYCLVLEALVALSEHLTALAHSFLQGRGYLCVFYAHAPLPLGHSLRD